MNIGQLGIVTGAAGSVAQARGTDVERVQHENVAVERVQELGLEADAAAGIGKTREEQSAGDRDADGRTLLTLRERRRSPDDAPSEESPADEEHHAKDPSGNAGSQLDISG